MDHDQAINTHAAERYLLDELSPEDRNNFEEHYFLCAKCADEVRSAFTFADNVTSVMEDQRRTAPAFAAPAKPRGFFAPLAWLRPAVFAPAFAVLFGVMMYQNLLQIPRIQRDLASAVQPRVVPTVVARAATRGEDPTVEISQGDRFVQVILDITPTVPVSSYTCEVYDAAGTLLFAVPAAAPSNGASLHLSLPVTELKSGRFIVRVRPSGEEYSFKLRVKSAAQ